MRDEIKVLEEVFKGVASKWDEQTSENLKKHEEVLAEVNMRLSGRIDAAEAAASQSIASLKEDLDSRVDLLAGEIDGCS
eukprot:COSAG02_NODE_22832_length_739_cov_0.948438_2_plen_78_part_01